MTTARAVNVVLVHGGFVDGPGGRASTRPSRKTATASALSRTRPLARRRRGGHEARSRRARSPGDPGRPLLRRSGDHGGRQRSQGRRTRVHRRVCSGQGRVRRVTHQGSAAGRARPPILPPQDGYSVARQGEVPRLLRRRRGRGGAAFMADSQVPWGVDALSGAISGRRGRPSPAGTWWPPRTG